MGCEKILVQICDELAEDINSETCQAIKKHLDECENCRNQLDSMRNMVALFRCMEEKNVPKGTHRRLLKMLNVEEKKM